MHESTRDLHGISGSCRINHTHKNDINLLVYFCTAPPSFFNFSKISLYRIYILIDCIYIKNNALLIGNSVCIIYTNANVQAITRNHFSSGSYSFFFIHCKKALIAGLYYWGKECVSISRCQEHKQGVKWKRAFSIGLPLPLNCGLPLYLLLLPVSQLV